ncbi:MAG: hypothetical protein ACRC32_25335 [Chroococcidiopsis sp.]
MHPARSKARSSMAIALCHWLKPTNRCARNRVTLSIFHVQLPNALLQGR